MIACFMLFSSPSMNQSARTQFLSSSSPPPPVTTAKVAPSPQPTHKNAVALAGEAPHHVTNEQFQAMIPSHFVHQQPTETPSSSIVINVKQPDTVGTLSEFQFPPVPTQLGQVTETITKSTLTETIVTRVTNNRLGALPIIIEVFFFSFFQPILLFGFYGV